MSAVLLLVDLTGAPREAGRRIAARLAHAHGAGAHSWTRSGDVGAFAWCDEGPIGVDLERVRDVEDWPRIAAEFLDSGTRDAIWRAADPLQEFLAAWTAFESRGKAAGVGITAAAPALPVSSFTIEHGGARFVGAVAAICAPPPPRWITA